MEKAAAEDLLRMYFTPQELDVLTPGEWRFLVALQYIDLPEASARLEGQFERDGDERLRAAIRSVKDPLSRTIVRPRRKKKPNKSDQS